LIREINNEIQNKHWDDIVDHSGDRIAKVMNFWWMLHGSLERLGNKGRLRR